MANPPKAPIPPTPEGALERGTPPKVTDESQDAKATVTEPPPPPPGTEPGKDGPPPPPPPPAPTEVEEVAALLAGGKVTKETVDDAFKSLARRKAVAEAEVKRLEGGLSRLRDIAATTRTTRLACFGQFDATAPFCTQTCRDPVCPAYTEHTKATRLAGLAPVLREQVERMGETPTSFASHEPSEMADGTPIKVE